MGHPVVSRRIAEAIMTRLRFDNATTAWHPTAPVNPESARAVHQIGRLGVWILHTQEERDAAIRLYQADLIETDGSLKP